MNYNEIDENIQDFLSSLHGHLIALQEHESWSNEPINEMEEHLDTVFEELAIKIDKKKTKKLLRYITKDEEETIELQLHIQNQIFVGYSVKGIDMPYYFKEEAWWKEV